MKKFNVLCYSYQTERGNFSERETEHRVATVSDDEKTVQWAGIENAPPVPFTYGKAFLCGGKNCVSLEIDIGYAQISLYTDTLSDEAIGITKQMLRESARMLTQIRRDVMSLKRPGN